MDCVLIQIDNGWWCRQCDPDKQRLLPQKMHRICLNTPDITKAAEKLGIEPKHIARYAKALLRWTLAGFPIRTDEEVKEIYEKYCEPCENFIDGRCKKCGCRTVRKGMILTNKIKLKTESCPLEKW